MALDPIPPSTIRRMSADDMRARLAAGPQQAARWIYAAAVNGYPVAQVVYGQMLLDGHGVATDPAAALRWFRIAATAGHLDGINMVGRCCELGWGTTPDVVEAARCYRQAADKGHAWARFNLATLMLAGRGLARDVPGAVSLLVRSARQRNAKAMNLLGNCREEGWIGPANVRAARRWHRRAADAGCFRGRFHTGRHLLADGEVEQAAEFFQSSVEIAPVDFCRDVAALLLDRPERSLRAVGLMGLRQAAMSGEPADLHALGHALATGRGGPADRAEARVWLARAAAARFPGAMGSLGP